MQLSPPKPPATSSRQAMSRKKIMSARVAVAAFADLLHVQQRVRSGTATNSKPFVVT